MTYTVYAYGNEDIDHTGLGDPQPLSLSEYPLDPGSTSTTLILSAKFDGIEFRFVAEGSFTYNSLKKTAADISSAVTTKISQYEADKLTLVETFDPPLNLLKDFTASLKEKLNTFSGDDIFVGSPTASASEAVRGYTGNDTFTGYGSGQFGDFFNGESGFDKAILRGEANEYTITSSLIYDIIKDDGKSNTPGFKVVDKIANRDGTDYYNNVERLYFSDKVVALDIDGNAGQAYRLYKAALDRTPDERGLAGWIKFMDEGGSLSTMAQQFIDSQEFSVKYGALDNTGFVNQLYKNVLARNGEPAGVAGWVGGLNNGLSRADVLKGFSESSENQANVIGQIKNGIAYTEWWLT